MMRFMIAAPSHAHEYLKKRGGACDVRHRSCAQIRKDKPEIEKTPLGQAEFHHSWCTLIERFVEWRNSTILRASCRFAAGGYARRRPHADAAVDLVGNSEESGEADQNPA
jgi:hypothetical protein